MSDSLFNAALGLAQASSGSVPSKYQDKFQSGLSLASGYATPPAVASVPTQASPSAPPEGSQFSGGLGAKLRAMWGTTQGKLVLVGALVGGWYLLRKRRKK